MITVTERAKEQLKTMLIASQAGPDEGLRLLPSLGGRFVLAIGTELSGDQVVEYEGHKVLLKRRPCSVGENVCGFLARGKSKVGGEQ